MTINDCGQRVLRRLAVGLLTLLASAQIWAQDTEQSDPGAIVAQATDRVMALVAEAGEYFDEDPDRYYAAIGGEVDDLIDFRSFARGVMGDAASGATYRQLDDAGKARLRGQLDTFSEVIRSGLIQTYGKGLLAFGGLKTEVLPAEIAPNNERLASVTQRVTGDQGQVYTLRYQMGLYRDGQWRLRNMIIENVNLGEIYRSQFADALEDANGDIDQVIAGWDVAPLAEG